MAASIEKLQAVHVTSIVGEWIQIAVSIARPGKREIVAVIELQNDFVSEEPPSLRQLETVALLGEKTVCLQVLKLPGEGLVYGNARHIHELLFRHAIML